MSKMSSHNPFGFLKHKLWPKEGLGVKLAIWLSNIKSQKLPWFPCMKVATTWKDLDKGYNFCLNLISIETLKEKLWASKVTEVPISGISGLQFKSPGIQ
jgi:hypothetical protein